MKDYLVFKLIAITAVSFFGGFGLIAEGCTLTGQILVGVAMASVTIAVMVTVYETITIK